MNSTEKACSGLVPDPGDEKKPWKGKFRFSIFFDGTNNNKFNVDAGAISVQKIKDGKELNEKEKEKLKKGESYTNAHSNVAKLYEGFKPFEKNTSSEKFLLHEPIYVEGIGTERAVKDAQAGFALGRGDTGVQTRVRQAIDRVVNFIVASLPSPIDHSDVTIEEIKFDLIGFSRGATAARNFEFQVFSELFKYNFEQKAEYMLSDGYVQPNSMYLPAGNLNELIEFRLNKSSKAANFPDSVVSFLGLFDTVASVYQLWADRGLLSKQAHKSLLDAPNLSQKHKDAEDEHHENEKELLGLDHPTIAATKVHITAKDEYRMNFPLTRSEGFTEIELPGAHSDIGGGYQEGPENVLIRVFSTEKRSDKIHEIHFEWITSLINQEIEWLENKGWILPIDSSDERVNMIDARDVKKYENIGFDRGKGSALRIKINTKEKKGRKLLILNFKEYKWLEATIVLTRKMVSNKFSDIPLIIMSNHMKDATLTFKPGSTPDELKEKKMSLWDQDLRDYFSQIGDKGERVAEVTDLQLLRRIKFNHHHMSAKVFGLNKFSETADNDFDKYGNLLGIEGLTDRAAFYPRFVHENGKTERKRKIFNIRDVSKPEAPVKQPVEMSGEPNEESIT